MSTFSNRSRFAFVVFLALALLIPMDRPLAEVAPIPLPAPPGAEPINNLYRSVFRIESTAQSFDYKAPWNSGGFGGGNGTGFLVGRNKILTNAHVISNTRRLQIRKYDEAGIYSARVLFIAQDCDLALIELEDPSVIEHLQPLELGSVPPLESEVRVIGYPIGGERLSVTRGVVSRIDFNVYSFSGIDSHLAIQIDAAINPGNSGGPVLQGDQVIGVAFQGMRGSAEGTGYIIPTPVIRRFLADIKNGHYDGYVDLGISTFKLFNAAQRRALGIPNDNKGVLVSRVYPKSSADGSLQANDILLEIDSYSILSDGRILLEGELVNLEEVVERKLHGESVALKILRGGEAQNVSFPLSTFEPARIHAVEYQTRPAYAMFGGLVFQPVSRNMLAAYAFDTLEIRKALDDYLNEDLYLERPELVVLTQVLTDSINADLAGVGGWVVDTINGEPVRKLADLVRILFEPLEAGTLPEFIVIRCRGAGRPFVLESRELAAAQRRIRAQYGISLDYRLPTPRGQTEW